MIPELYGTRGPSKTACRESFLDNAYPVELLRCPRCGLTWVSEELALGKMAEVEKTLEKK